MAKFTVHMTFAAPSVRARLKITRELPCRISLRLLGGDGTVAALASPVQAETPAEAVLLVQKAVLDHWSKADGPLTMVSWTAKQDRVFAGRPSRRRTDWSSSATASARRPPTDDEYYRPWNFDDPDDGDDPGGSAGVREPRRPLPGPGSLHAAAEPPGPAGF